jgi:hypothetical protein
MGKNQTWRPAFWERVANTFFSPSALEAELDFPPDDPFGGMMVGDSS